MARNSQEKISFIMPTSKRRKLSSFPLEDLPDETILKIFSFLDRKNLFRASLVSKRTYNISQDSSMFQRWLKINFYNKTLPTSLLEKVLAKGCKYLSLQHATLEGRLRLEKRISLKCLDISNCQSNIGMIYIWDEIFANCYSLEKLCLIDSRLILGVIKDMTALNGQTLQVLNMINCRGLNLDKMKLLIDRCVQLKELNLRDADISEEAIDYLVKNLTPNIEKLSLANQEYFIGNNEIKTLVSRCKNLNSLDLRNTGIGDDSLTAIIENLQDTLENLNVADNRISYRSLEELDSCQLLMFLKCDGWDRHSVNRLKRHLPGVEVNKRGSYFSVASSAYKEFKKHSHPWVQPN